MTDFAEMPEEYKIKLHTESGAFVAEVADPVAAMMVHNGKHPELVLWGERFFVYADNMGYREVMCTVICLNEQLPTE